jgi:hypothetical protein
MCDCIDLRSTYGDRYVIRYEESRRGLERDKWLEIIPTRCGHLFPWGNSKLAASIDGHPKLARRVAALPTARVHVEGTDGTTVLFDISDFDAVARIVKPICRRTTTKSIFTGTRRLKTASTGSQASRKHAA